MEAFLSFRRAEPQLTHLLGTELSAAEREIAARRRQLIIRLGALLSGRGESEEPGRDAAAAVHLAAASLALSCNQGEGQASVLPDLAAELSELVALAGERVA